MAKSFFFYDLETSGVSPYSSRIMQFAGQRTDMNLKPIGQAYNYYIKLTEDILPEPDAILLTGITPQKTLAEGMSEAEFFRIFYNEIFTPDTIFVGFNSVRFDDEFMRFGMYRNFYDAYEWQWKDGTSRWDVLDLVRITRALRPDGIKWPFASDGKASNRLELLSSLNKLDHADAHDALSDVTATIAVAQMIKTKQPKLFNYLLNLRTKKSVSEFVNNNPIFAYVSGRYSSNSEKLALVTVIGEVKNQGFLVFDLSNDPELVAELSIEELNKRMSWADDDEILPLPIKLLKPNRCPAIAPLSVLTKPDQERLNINLDTIKSNYQKLTDLRNTISNKYLKAYELQTTSRQAEFINDQKDVDGQLYDGFINNHDKQLFTQARSDESVKTDNFYQNFTDERLKNLWKLYKARNYPKYLSDDEQKNWLDYKNQKIAAQAPRFSARLNELANQKLTPEKQYVLEELSLYAQSLIELDLN